MKLIVIAMTALLVGSSTFANETSSPTANKSTKADAGQEKKSRKKKVEMCADCGKPESECDCPAEVKEKEKKEKEKEKKQEGK